MRCITIAQARAWRGAGIWVATRSNASSPPCATQRVTRSADGLRCEFKVAVTEEVVAWVLRWGASARVVEPADLARRVRDEMTRGAALYLKG